MAVEEAVQAAEAVAPETVDPVAIAQQLSTNNLALDVFLFLLASVILTLLAAWYHASKEQALTGLSGMIRKWMIRFGLASKTYQLTVEFNTIVNKWGDENAFNCSWDNSYMFDAVFTYAAHLKCLRDARVDVVEKRSTSNNKYQRMLAKQLQLKGVTSLIVVDSDISVQVTQSVDKGTEKTGRSTRSSAVIESKTSFKACREFAQRAYDFFVEKNYKEYDDEDESKKLKYYSIRNIDHEAGDITWNQYYLNTERQFDYLYFDEKEATIKLIDNFVNKTAQFAIGGPAYKLGFLLYGVPGCGKTSFIKALANHTQRHIVDVHLSKFAKNSELRDAFFQTELTAFDVKFNTQKVNIPLDKRIIIMEDIDALSDLVQRRSETDTWNEKDFKKLAKKGDDEDEKKKAGSDEEATEKEEEGEAEKKEEDGLFGAMSSKKKEGSKDAIDRYLEKHERMEDRLNLAALLSILDGTLELTGPILIMTTNLPEKLDPALIRSGRITKHIYFGRCSVPSMASMMEFYFGDRVRVKESVAGEFDRLDQEAIRNSLRGSGACVDLLTLTPSDDDELPALSPSFRAKYAPLFRLMPEFERYHRKIAPNDLEAICRNSVDLEECCKTVREFVAAQG